MGPRLINRGNIVGCSTPVEAGTASMGPRLINRGNCASGTDELWRKRRASMGPRLINRGNPPDD